MYNEYEAIFGPRIEAARNKPAFRDYDAEWTFIGNMETLGEYYHQDAVIVNGENPKIVGLWLEDAKEAANAGKLDSV